MGLADGGGHPAVLVKAAGTSDTVGRVTASTGSLVVGWGGESARPGLQEAPSGAYQAACIPSYVTVKLARHHLS